MFLKKLPVSIFRKLIKTIEPQLQQQVRECTRIALDEIDNYRIRIAVKNVEIEIDIVPRDDHPEFKGQEP